MMRIKYNITALLVIMAAACSPGYTKFLNNYPVVTGKTVPDYAGLDDWAAHPGKWDPSDSIPTPLRTGVALEKTADVFFIHPTTYTSKKQGTTLNADISDASLNAKTDYSAILYQASVFNEQCRVYAPRYRQARLDAFYMKDTAAARVAFELAYEDVKAAFEYYVLNENKGRPIIIAAHSQGTVHAGRLLKEYFEDRPLMRQLVAAYIIGMPLPKNYFTVLQPCNDPLQTGCMLGWRTLKQGYLPDYAKKETPGSSYVVNPLNWSTGTDKAARHLNKGAVLKNFNKLYSGVCNAAVANNVLWVHKPRFPFSFLIRMRNYHVGDINLFYVNIRENVKARLAAFFRQQQ